MRRTLSTLPTRTEWGYPRITTSLKTECRDRVARNVRRLEKCLLVKHQLTNNLYSKNRSCVSRANQAQKKRSTIETRAVFLETMYPKLIGQTTASHFIVDELITLSRAKRNNEVQVKSLSPLLRLRPFQIFPSSSQLDPQLLLRQMLVFTGTTGTSSL